jgi:phosphatidylserine/phosphatidylglycerophosphate/cardiolipin synthase-like enzyme
MHVVSTAFAGATKSIDLEMYEFTDQALEAQLAAKEAAGVKVSVILDNDYERSYNQPAATYLESHHVTVTWAPASTIYHAKFAVIDGRELLVGTGNFTSQYYATTRDFWVVDTQKADITAATTVFRADLAGHTSVVAKGADLLFSPGSTSALVNLISSATSTLQVENEEMDSYTITDALEAAARRGVHVTVIMTYSSEWSSAFTQLKDAGVHVFVDHGESPIYIHAKAMCADCSTSHARAFVGSENFSTSSLSYNRELGIITSSRSITAPLSATLTSDAAQAQPW